MDELAGQYVGGYLLEEEIGRGSMGVIYRGKQIALGREVAIKVLPQKLAKDPSYVARFIARHRSSLDSITLILFTSTMQDNSMHYCILLWSMSRGLHWQVCSPSMARSYSIWPPSTPLKLLMLSTPLIENAM